MRDSDRREGAQELPEPEAESASASESDLDGAFGKVSRILQKKRWDVREGPFRGFDSPPGRF